MALISVLGKCSGIEIKDLVLTLKLGKNRMTQHDSLEAVTSYVNLQRLNIKFMTDIWPYQSESCSLNS